MKKSQMFMFGIVTLLIGSVACKTEEITIPETNMQTTNNSNDTTSNQLKIRIASRTFTAKLLNNETVTAFKARLPMTVSMSELNGNEKLYRFPVNLPTSPVNPRTIHSGDLMIYGSNTVVLFYQSFPTLYHYTKLGQIRDTTGLAAAVGSANVTVTFELE